MEVTPMNRPMSARLMLADRMDAGISMDVNSDDIEMVETVTVISRWNEPISCRARFIIQAFK